MSTRPFLVTLCCWGISTCSLLAAEQLPQWIWGSDAASHAAQQGICEFRHTFQLVQPTCGTLDIACDDRYIVRLNGRLIGIGRGWQAWHAYDVSTLLHDGHNELVVHCRNDGGPAGLALKLQVESNEAASATIVSDAQWQAKMQQEGTWDPTVKQRTPWSQAYVLGPVQVTEPWRDGPRSGEHLQKVQAAAKRNLGGPFELTDDDRVLFLGNTLIERAQRYGYCEAALTTAFPERRVVFRNLGWSGDTVFGHARARFGTPAEGFEHLETHVFAEQPTCVFVGYGANESFAGKPGVADFVAGLNRLLDVLLATGAEVVLVTPNPFENMGPPLPDHHSQNRNLALYADAIRDVAGLRKMRLVDLFQRLPQVAREHGISQPLTENGIHLSRLGYWCAAQAILAELGIDSDQPQVAMDVETGRHHAQGVELTIASRTPQQIDLKARPDRLQIPSPSTPDDVSIRLQVRQLPPGRYRISVDDQSALTVLADELSSGVTVPVNDGDAGRLIRQICHKNELYFHRWRPQNETYLFLFRKHEQGNNAGEIPQFDPLILEVEESIAALRRPRVLSIEIVSDDHADE